MIDGVIDQRVEFVDFSARFRWIEIIVRMACKCVELTVEHAHNFGGFVVDDGIRLGVPKYGNSDPARVVSMSPKVELIKIFGAVGLVSSRPRMALEGPSVLKRPGRDD